MYSGIQKIEEVINHIEDNITGDLHISEKYGYASQSAFVKAFGEQHGASPTACLKGNCDINLKRKEGCRWRMRLRILKL